MSSEHLASAQNELKGNLGGAWNILDGAQGQYQDLGIARRFGGAAAAYSLRDIGAMNGSVVRVRREPEDTTDGIDDEEKFSANQVQSGALEDWVNGKLESTLPADVATAAAAYSLRKVKADYTGDAVRIRRSSDDVEVNVALDSDGKVSASSAITNIAEQGGEIGSTTATDLNGFLNETLTVGTAENGTGGFSNYTLTNVSDTGFSADNSAGGTGSAGFPYKHNTGDVIVLRFTVSNFNSTSSLSPVLRGTDSLGSVVGTTSGGNEILANGTYTETHTASADGIYLMFADGNTGSYTISDFQIVSHTHQAFVHTWYDQAGSNDAVQETDANQPKIAENGALLADGVTFDGTNDFLQTSTQVLTGTQTGANSMYAVIKQTSGDGGYICGSAGTGGTGARVGQSLYSSDTDKVILTDGQDASTGGTLDSITRIEGSNYLISVNYSNNNTNTLHSNSNANGYSNGSSAYAFSAGTKFTIGARDGSTSAAAVLFDGSMKEIIAYDSDQSANRFKIESNINNYYGLYNDEYEWDDAVNTEWQNNVTDGATTFTANGKDGFTITATGENKSSFKYKITSPSTASNDYYKVSFNVDDPDGLFTDAQLRLTATGAGATSQTITNGFNSMSLRTGASFEYMSINSDASGSSKTATLSNFKISLIARNGFVERLYDQSGNGNNATQASASSQPNIISNGGQVTLDNGTPSIAFKRASGEGSDNMSISTPIANEPYTFFATTVNNADNPWFRLFGESNAAPTVLLRNNNTIDYNPSDSDVSGSISATTTSDNIVSGFSGVNGGADGILRFNGTNLKTDISRTQDGDSISLVGRFPNDVGGFAHIESLIFYESDLTADFDTIEKELAQPINIL